MGALVWSRRTPSTPVDDSDRLMVNAPCHLWRKLGAHVTRGHEARGVHARNDRA